VDDHLGARSGWDHDRTFGLIEDIKSVSSHLTRLIGETDIERRLSAAGLAFGKVHPATRILEDGQGRSTHLGS
jgi:hypothetical protein